MARDMTEVEARHYRRLADLYAREMGCACYALEDVVDWAMAKGLLPSSGRTLEEVQRETQRLAERSEAEGN